MGTTITEQSISEFKQWLVGEERQSGTIEKYTKDVRELKTFLKDDELTNETVSIWKAYLLSQKRLAPITINSKLAAVGTYCRFAGIDCRVKSYKIQRKLFYEGNKNGKCIAGSHRTCLPPLLHRIYRHMRLLLDETLPFVLQFP